VGPSSGRPLLAAKMLVPLPRPGAVARRRLHERLRLAEGTRLTTVVAPAGWGKTTLLATWARDPAQHGRVAWLSLDEADDEPVRFWTYALSALQSVAPHLVADALPALSAMGLDPTDAALPALLNALSDETRSDGAAQRVLVLDDFHAVTDAAIAESLEFLLSYLPPSLHLVIASRVDPPLPLARMRARGVLTEIRLDDLRCTADEGARAGRRRRRRPRRRQREAAGADRGLAGWSAPRSAHRPRRPGRGREGGRRRRRSAHPGLLLRRGRERARRGPADPSRPMLGAGATVRPALRCRSRHVGQLAAEAGAMVPRSRPSRRPS
jgi:hypothetical protein